MIGSLISRPYMITIPCNSTFRVERYSASSPKLKMKVDQLIDNEFFELDVSDHETCCYNQFGPKLKCKAKFIDLFNTDDNRRFDGGLYPGFYGGYDVTINGREGSFVLSAAAKNFIKPDNDPSKEVGLLLTFVSDIPNAIMLEYMGAVNEFNNNSKKDIEEAEAFMKYITG